MNKLSRIYLSTLISLSFLFCLSQTALAAAPVRLSITADSGSGIEQDIVDYISSRFSEDSNIVISTVNPDWFVQCKITSLQDRMSGQIRYNGTVIIKTTDGQTVDTVSVQKYNQDFSLRTGTPLNKKLVDSAAKEVINVVGERAADKISSAVQVELAARDQIIQADSLANSDKYDDAITALKQIGRDSVHFQAVQLTIAKFEMEKHVLELVNAAEVKGKQGQYSQAISLLKDVDLKSKRYKLSKQLSSKYRNLLEAARLRTKKLAKNNGSVVIDKAALH